MYSKPSNNNPWWSKSVKPTGPFITSIPCSLPHFATALNSVEDTS